LKGANVQLQKSQEETRTQSPVMFT